MAAYDDMPLVGEFGRKLIACDTPEQAKALLGITEE